MRLLKNKKNLSKGILFFMTSILNFMHSVGEKVPLSTIVEAEKGFLMNVMIVQ